MPPEFLQDIRLVCVVGEDFGAVAKYTDPGFAATQPSSNTILSTFFFLLFRSAPVAYRNSQAMGRIGAEAASLHHSHSNSNTRAKLHFRATPQLTATLDP